jgi:hypothetical protein
MTTDIDREADEIRRFEETLGDLIREGKFSLGPEVIRLRSGRGWVRAVRRDPWNTTRGHGESGARPAKNGPRGVAGWRVQSDVQGASCDLYQYGHQGLTLNSQGAESKRGRPLPSWKLR